MISIAGRTIPTSMAAEGRKIVIVRLLVSLLLLAAVAFMTLTVGFDLATGSTLERASDQAAVPVAERAQIAPPANNTTVITGQGFSGRNTEALVAIAPDGRLLYFNDSFEEYADVDPSPTGTYTVTYTTNQVLSSEACGAQTKCSKDMLLRTNLSTGESEVLYTRKQAAKPGEIIHDVDRIDESRFIVADIVFDQVSIVNVTTGLVVWEWHAQQAFPLSGGGPYPEDWTHMNDVEVIDDGRYMVSLRNQDQVVFLDRDGQIDTAWTLGAEDAHDVIYEQHNPDYIPADRGGPALLVADSQNNRIVEFQRADGAWHQSWVWRDSALRWPRDADRLPNDNTLITDSNNDRIIEVDASGEIVWRVDVATPYEAERLETGDESATGRSARAANLTARTYTGTKSHLKTVLRERFPPKVANAIRFLYPGWASLGQVLAAAGVFALGVVWIGLELWLTRLRIVFQWPLRELGVRSPIRIEVGDRPRRGENT
jgi:hypothetical protein